MSISYTSKTIKCACGAKASLRTTQLVFADAHKDDAHKDLEQIAHYMKKYEQLKEVIQNIIDRLDEGAELTLTKDSIIVHCLKEAIK